MHTPIFSLALALAVIAGCGEAPPPEATVRPPMPDSVREARARAADLPQQALDPIFWVFEQTDSVYVMLDGLLDMAAGADTAGFAASRTHAADYILATLDELDVRLAPWAAGDVQSMALLFASLLDFLEIAESADIIAARGVENTRVELEAERGAVEPVISRYLPLF